jgi:hypothetical protein
MRPHRLDREWLLLVLLARPMLAFVLVLESFERAQRASRPIEAARTPVLP